LWGQFVGDDDTWIFVNNQLVLDMGGVNWFAHEQYMLDSVALGLEDGKIYTVKWFHAQRCGLSHAYCLRRAAQALTQPQQSGLLAPHARDEHRADLLRRERGPALRTRVPRYA
jgi:fibro-slime domain-containing protein